jgi:ATP-binding protein involved in chromosome partitioning
MASSTGSGPALTTAQVLDALGGVIEPELRRPITQLDMVRDVTVDGPSVTVEVAVKTADDPVGQDIAESIGATLMAMAGVEGVHVVFDVMTDDERRLLKSRLRADDAAHENVGAAPQGHAGGPRVAPRFMQPDAKTRVLAITSGKGGVGKSSTTTNLAIALARRGLHVGLLDADVYGFSIPKMLGIEQMPTVIDGMVIPPVAYGVSAMSIGFMVDEDQAVIWRGPMLHKALEQFLTDVYWGEPDYLLVDMPPGTGDIALSMADYLPRAEVFVVTTPQPAAQRVAQRSALMARNPKINMVVKGVIENMSWFVGDDEKRYEIFGAGGGAELAASLKVPLIGQIPLVPALRAGMDTGNPIMATDPDSEAGRAYAAIAEKIVTELGPTRIYKRELRIG